MKGNILKKLNENMPSFVKVMAKDIIRKKLIANKVFIDTYQEIKEFNKLSEDEQEKVQFKKLKEQLIYAYENVSYYKQSFDKYEFNPYEFKDKEELKKLPIIKKEDLLNSFEKFCSKENIKFYEAHTGGSSGKPLTILLDNESIYKERAFVYSFWSDIGYDFKKSRMITFRGVEYKDKISKYNPLYNELLLSPFKLNNDNIENYIKEINKFNPEFISGYPSAITNFVNILKNNAKSLNVNIKGIFLISENTTESEYKIIKEFFKCPVITFYGHSERAVFAENYIDNYSFNKLYGYVELIEFEKNKYRIVCTGFLNKKMPLVRYITDDIVEIQDEKIHIIGHWDKELLIGKNDEKISIASINFHSDEFKDISKYQFIQSEKGKVDIYLECGEDLSEKHLYKIKNALNKKLLGILDYKLIVVDKIKLTARGKFKKVIQNIK